MSKSEQKDDAYHREKMIKKKASREKIEKQKSIEKGLCIVHTGNGKGKSTAAFGMVLRALGHNMRVGIVQFVKGSRQTGERLALAAFEKQIDFYACGEGFTWETQDRKRDVLLAEKVWVRAKAMLSDESFDLVLCDELNIILRYKYLDIEEVLNIIEKRPKKQHIIITGRNAPEELIEKADLVTQMQLVKHPFKSGVKSQRGIEF